MAVNFGLITQVPTVAGRFIEGQQAAAAEADRNMLRQAQMEQMAAQRENILAQREDRRLAAAERQAKMARAAERQKFLNGLSAEMAKGGYKLDRPTLGKMLDFGMSSGEDSLIKLATEGLRALDEDERERVELARLGMGGTAAAPAAAPATLPGAAPAAPTNLLAGTPYDIGPVNALAAPAPAAAPAAPAGVTREQVQQMLQSPSARVRERGKALLASLPKEAAAPADVATMKALGIPVTPEGAARFYAMKRQPAAQVNVKLPDQEKAFETGLGRAQAERIMDDQKVAQDARGIIDTVQQGRQLLRSGAITGFGAEALTQIGAALNQIGINFAEDKVANTQAFAANMAQNVGRIIKQFGAGTGLSNADREYAEKMAGGKITLDKAAIERILDINERAARNVISAHNKRVQGIKTNVPLTVEEPPAAAPAAAPTGRLSLDQIFKR